MEFDGLEESSNMGQLANDYRPQSQVSANTYIPQVRDEHIPKIGQEFSTLDDVQTFYNNYAKEGGFSIRNSSSRRSQCKDRENEILMKEYVCYKEGGKHIVKDEVDVKVRRGNIREGCKARLRVSKSKQGPHYMVSIFDEGHNHPLTTPKKVGLLRSHRHVSDVKKCLTQQFSMANIPTHQQMSIMELQAGGIGNIGCTEKDIRNEQHRVRKLLDGFDADLVYEYFLEQQESNPSFRYVIEADSDRKITHVFWADATMRMAYSFYGDVIVFDTTYCTNRYGMIFAPIVGVNCHSKTITFSCAFLCDESTESFEWLFSQFLRFMPGPPPMMIITDQDLAIEKAISIKLPGTHYRFCIWHILNKFSEKLGGPVYDEHFTEFKSCIWDSEHRDEFDSNWSKLLACANLKEHKWLNGLYEVRDKWIPAYVRHIFSAGMSSSQRVESHHAFFKRYGDKRNSLMDFIHRFNRGLARQRYGELNDDHININEQPSLKTILPMEKQMAELYTRCMFYKFQEELWQSQVYSVNVKSREDCKCIYLVIRVDGTPSRGREVLELTDSDYVSCSCKKFDCEGIPCRHMLALFKMKQLVYLPKKYVLSRWTKAAKMGKVIDCNGVEVSDACDRSLFSRRTKLSQLSNSIIDDVVRDEGDSMLFEDTLLQFRTKLKISKSTSAVGESPSIILPRQSTYSEPSQVNFKGCGKRLKRGKEKAKPKGRRCNYCGEIGATHDKRNCPKKNIGVSSLGTCVSPTGSSPNDDYNSPLGLDDEDSA